MMDYAIQCKYCIKNCQYPTYTHKIRMNLIYIKLLDVQFLLRLLLKCRIETGVLRKIRKLHFIVLLFNTPSYCTSLVLKSIM